MAKEGIPWQLVDPKMLSQEAQAAFEKMKTADKAWTAARDDLFAKARSHAAAKKWAPDDKVATFNYTGGDALMIAFKNAEDAKADDRTYFQPPR